MIGLNLFCYQFESCSHLEKKGRFLNPSISSLDLGKQNDSCGYFVLKPGKKTNGGNKIKGVYLQRQIIFLILVNKIFSSSLFRSNFTLVIKHCSVRCNKELFMYIISLTSHLCKNNCLEHMRRSQALDISKMAK